MGTRIDLHARISPGEMRFDGEELKARQETFDAARDAKRLVPGNGTAEDRHGAVPVSQAEIAYIMKGFPRLSEPFISNEVYLLEQLGLRLRVFALQSLSEKKFHSSVSQIKAPVSYVPEDPAAADSPFAAWLKENLPKFVRNHAVVLRRRPLAYAKIVARALQFSIKYRSRLWSLKKSFYKDFLRAGYIAGEVLQAGNIRHLHGHFCHGSTTITMWASELTGVPFSFTAHAKDIYLPALNPGDLLPRKIRAAQFVATCTDANRIHLQHLCSDASSIHTVYHGLSTEFFAPSQQAQESWPPTILAVGRLVKKKGFPYLIEACAILQRQGVDFRCLIVGAADEDSAAVKQLIEKLKLQDRVELQGPVSQEKLRDLYHQCALFALPCLIVGNGDRDGIPNVLVEAMATAKPVVTTNVSGIPELVQHGVNGMLVAPQDPEALAATIEALLSDRDLRLRLGNRARETVCQRFDSAKTTLALKRLFETSIGGGAASSL